MTANAMFKITERKQPFLPSTRQDGNNCFCAACGAMERAVPRTGVSGFLPNGWSWRLITGENVPDGKAHVFQCAACTSSSKDGPDATAFYDKYDMTWSSTSRRWEPTPTSTPRAAEEQIQAPAATKEEEKTMTTNGAVEKAEKPTLKERTIGQAKDVGGALGLGLKLAAADEVGELLVDVFREFAKDNPMLLALLSDETGREFVKMTMAFSMQSACVHTSMIPQSAFVKAAAELQMTASMEALAKPQMKNFRKLVGQMAVIGEKMAEAQGGAGEEAASETEAAAPKERASARAR